MIKVSSARSLALGAAAGLALALAGSAAIAQDYDYDNDDSSAVSSNGEEVEVTAPRPHLRGEYGAPIQDVAISRPVRFDDLDLRSRHGAHLLRARIRSTALTLCRQLDAMHPVKADDSPECYPTAVEDAMAQANDAIATARDQ